MSITSVSHFMPLSLRVTRNVIYFTSLLFIIACSRGSGENANPVAESVPINPIVEDAPETGPVVGRVVLGPVVGATVQIFALNDLDNPVCESITGDSTDLSSAGRFELPANCVSSGGDYVIVSSGGRDIDADDDGVLDDVPTDVEGEVRALLSADEMRNEGWKVSVLTESVFQALQHNVNTGASAEELQALKDSLSARYLTDDLNGDGTIDFDDLLIWDPAEQMTSITNEDVVDDLLQEIHSGALQVPEDPSSVVTEGIDSLDIGSTILAVAEVGESLAVATRSALIMVDTSAGELRIVSSTPTGWINDLEYIADTVYLSIEGEGLVIYDVSEPSQPERTSTLSANAGWLARFEQYLLSTAIGDDNSTDLIVIDVSTGESPSVVSRVPIHSATTLSLQANNSHAYIVWGGVDVGGEVSIFDLSDPTSPIETDQPILFDIFSNAYEALAFDGNVAYTKPHTAFSSSNPRIDIFDVENASAPALVQTVDIETDVRAIAFGNGGMVRLTGDALRGFDLPGLSQAYELPLQHNHRGMSIIEDTAYLYGSTLTRVELPEIAPSRQSTGAALLGRVVGANVTVHRYPDFDGEPLCSASTSDSDVIDRAGLVTLPAGCAHDAGLYRVTISGGIDIDANNDGIRDAQGTPVQGSMHALLTHLQLAQDGWAVTPLTEVAYQLQSAQFGSLEANAVRDNLDVIASLLLSGSIEGNAVLDADDLNAWQPRSHGGSLLVEGNALVEAITSAIVSGNSVLDAIHDEAFNVPSFLIFSNYVAHISGSETLIAALSANRIHLIDVSDEDQMVELANITLSGVVEHLVLGDLLLVSAANSDSQPMLHIYDISDPSDPQLLSQLNEPAQKLAMHEGLIVMTSLNADGTELLTVDISNPLSPTVTGRLSVHEEFTVSLQVHDEHAYLVWGSISGGFVSIVSLADPSTPVLVDDSIRFDIFGRSIEYFAFQEDIGYSMPSRALAPSNPVTEIFDFSNPSSPSLIARVPVDADMRDMAISNGGIVRLTGTALQGVQLPGLGQAYEIPFPQNYGSMEVIGNTAYLFNNTLTRVALPVIEPSLPTTGVALLGRVVNASVTVHRYPELSGDALCTTTTSDSDEFQEAGRITLPIGCVNNPGLYLITVSGGQDIDVDNDGVRDSIPTAVQGEFHALLTHIELSEDGWQVTALTESAYQLASSQFESANAEELQKGLDVIAGFLLSDSLNGQAGVDTADVNAWHPLQHGSQFVQPSDDFLAAINNAIRTGTLVGDVVRDNQYSIPNSLVLPSGIRTLSGADAMIAVQGQDGIQLVDISDPDAMSLSGFVDLDSVSTVLLTEDFVYVSATPHDGQNYLDPILNIYSISDPSSPQLISQLQESAEFMALSDLHLLVTTNTPYQDTELLSIDVSDPYTPTVVSRVGLHDQLSLSLRAHQSHAYVVWGSISGGFVSIFDAQDPTSLIRAGTDIEYDVFSNAHHYWVFDGTTAYTKPYGSFTGSNNPSTNIYDVTVPSMPLLLGSESIEGDLRDIVIHDGKMFRLTGTSLRGYTLPGLELDYDRTLQKNYTGMRIVGDSAYLYSSDGTITGIDLPE